MSRPSNIIVVGAGVVGCAIDYLEAKIARRGGLQFFRQLCSGVLYFDVVRSDDGANLWRGNFGFGLWHNPSLAMVQL